LSILGGRGILAATASAKATAVKKDARSAKGVVEGSGKRELGEKLGKRLGEKRGRNFADVEGKMV
jgi:hypothetical protein